MEDENISQIERNSMIQDNKCDGANQDIDN